MEDVLLPDTEEGSGYETPRVRQYTVFLENKVGRLQMLVRALEASSSRMAGLSIHESSDAALVRLICCNADVGREVLTEAGFPFTETNLLAVELPRKVRQPLIAICQALLSAEINIHYAYPLLLSNRSPSLAIYTDDLTLAARIFIRKGFNLLGESDLARWAEANGNQNGLSPGDN